MKTAVVRILVNFGVPRRKIHPRQNRLDEALLPQDALVGEESELVGLRIVGHAPARVFLIFGIRNSVAAEELRPILVVVAFMNREVTETPCFGKWGGINRELFLDEVEDAHLRRGPWLRALALQHFPLGLLWILWALKQVGCLGLGIIFVTTVSMAAPQACGCDARLFQVVKRTGGFVFPIFRQADAGHQFLL